VEEKTAHMRRIGLVGGNHKRRFMDGKPIYLRFSRISGKPRLNKSRSYASPKFNNAIIFIKMYLAATHRYMGRRSRDRGDGLFQKQQIARKIQGLWALRYHGSQNNFETGVITEWSRSVCTEVGKRFIGSLQPTQRGEKSCCYPIYNNSDYATRRRILIMEGEYSPSTTRIIPFPAPVRKKSQSTGF
jgi:hypothetical protein